MVISFVCLAPVHPFLSSMAVLYHVNKEREQQRQRLLRKRHLKSEVALLQTLSRLIHLVQFVKCWKFFSRVEFYKIVSKFRKRKRNLSPCVHVLDKTWNYAFSRPRRALTAKKCRKKRDARAGLLFCQSKPRPIAYFCRFRWRHRRRCLSSVITSYRRLISRSRIWFKMTSHFLNVLLQKLISSDYFIISNGHSLYLWQSNTTYIVSVLLFAPSGVIKAMVAHSLKSWRIHVKVLCMLSKDSEY